MAWIVDPYYLSLALAAIEADGGAQTGENTESGMWRQFALAAEALSSTTSTANSNTAGFMLRAATALETLSATTGNEENRTKAGLLKRIVDALEVLAGQVYTGSLEQRLVQAAGAAVYGGTSLGAPILARTGVAGTAPFTWSVNVTGANIYPGYYWHLQEDNNSDFSSVRQDIYQLITADEGGDLDSLIEDFVQQTGATSIRLRAVIDDGASGPGSGTNGAWSNTLTDNIVSSVAVLADTNGVNKSRWTAVTGTPKLSFAGVDGTGLKGHVRTATLGAAKGQFEYTVTGYETGITIGMNDGTQDLDASGGVPPYPGFQNSTGIMIAMTTAGGSINWNSDANSQDITAAMTGSPKLQAGDVYTVRYDRTGGGTTGTLELWRTRAGVTIQIGTTVTGLDVNDIKYPHLGAGENGDAGTINFGGSAFSKALADGYSMYG